MQADYYRLGYRADIEGLRAVAILLVLAAHARVPWLAGGFVGVDVFFVLSGFLITGLLLREMDNRESIRFGDFYARRIRRLLPGLVAMVLVVCLLARCLLAPSDQQAQAGSAASALFWISNFHFATAQLDYFSAGAEGNLFLHTWSLGVEEQFYLLWPALLLWLSQGPVGEPAARTRRLKKGLSIIFLSSLAACVICTYMAPRLAFYMMPLRAWQFAAGALTWLYFGGSTDASGTTRLALWRNALGWSGLAAILFAALWLTPGFAYPGAWALLPTGGAVSIVAASCAGSVGVSRLLAWRPLQALGRRSYAWYLWHWPVLLLARSLFESESSVVRAGAVAVSLGLAAASYRWVEAPVRHRQVWLARPRLTVAASLAVMALGSLCCLRWYNHAWDLEHSPQNLRLAAAHSDAPVIYEMGCDQWYSSDELHVCTFGATGAPHTAVLFGDSVAAQWFPALARIYRAPNCRLLVVTKSACPMVDEPIFYARIGRIYTQCAVWRRRAVRYLTDLRPEVLWMGSVATYAYSMEQWIGGTKRLLSSLSPAVGHIYLLRSTPHLPFNGPDCLAAHEARAPWLSLASDCSAQAEDVRDTEVFSWLQWASTPYPNVSVVDLNGWVCPKGRCRAGLGGVVVFRDTQHITASFAASLAGPISARLQPQGAGGN